MHFQNRLEYLIGFLKRNLGRRDDGNLSLHPLIDDEIRSRKLADELDKYDDIDVVEIDGNEPIGLGIAAHGL